jgi:hypothetical protein
MQRRSIVSFRRDTFQRRDPSVTRELFDMVQQSSGHALPPELIVHDHTVNVTYALPPFHRDEASALSETVLMNEKRHLTVDAVWHQGSVVAVQHVCENLHI